MRLSRHFGQTLRSAPSDAETPGYQMLLRGGYVRQLGSGIFDILPLGCRVLRNVERILREEMNSIGGEEVSLPVAQPAEIWQETGRWSEVGDELLRFKDRAGRSMVLAMTHEEAITDLVRREITSYRQLPALLYQIQMKFRDEARSRAGLIRVREFMMKDSYSLDRDVAGLERQYQSHYEAYQRIFARCGLSDVIAVQSDPGVMGGKIAHEFMYLSPVGEDTLTLCDRCRFSSNLQVARFHKPAPPTEPLQPLEKVATPGCTTIESLAAFLAIPAQQTAKVVFFSGRQPTSGSSTAIEPSLIMAVVRGDMEVNETKLCRAAGVTDLRPAAPNEIAISGAVPGYASPVGLDPSRATIVLDDLVARTPNLVAGANETGYHLRGVNIPRDFQPQNIFDIASAFQGAGCPECGEPLRLVRGVEVGNIFQLGTRYSDAMSATYLDENGQPNPVVMGSYGIGVGRLLACLAEAHHDERGIAWPVAVAPFDLHLVRLSAGSSELETAADELYESLCATGLDLVYDDRAASPGVKFADADLIGAPLRITISARSIQAGGVELKLRRDNDVEIVPLEIAPERALAAYNRILSAAGLLPR